MAYELAGLYAMSLRGVMHGQSLTKQKYIGGDPLRVGLGGQVDLSTVDHNLVPKTAERPVLTAFYPSQYPVPPSPPPTGQPPIPALPALLKA